MYTIYRCSLLPYLYLLHRSQSSCAIFCAILSYFTSGQFISVCNLSLIFWNCILFLGGSFFFWWLFFLFWVIVFFPFHRSIFILSPELQWHVNVPSVGSIKCYLKTITRGQYRLEILADTLLNYFHFTYTSLQFRGKSCIFQSPTNLKTLIR